MTTAAGTDGLTVEELDGMVWRKAWEIAHGQGRYALRREDLVRAERFYGHTIREGRP